MLLTDMVKHTNALLAGESCSLLELVPFFDMTIQDINQDLGSVYPTMSEHLKSIQPPYTEYSFFPDRYIITVLCLGAAVHFYMADEEGNPAPMGYTMRYEKNRYMMQRDFIGFVPLSYQDNDVMGAVPLRIGDTGGSISVSQGDFLL